MLPVSFFFNAPATTEIYTLSLHDALPILLSVAVAMKNHPDKPKSVELVALDGTAPIAALALSDRKSTRLNSSHLVISYAVFCLKKKKNTTNKQHKSYVQQSKLYYFTSDVS